jgi:outer membrane lipoprotein-sorting protein
MQKALLVTCLIALPWIQAGARASVDLDLAGLSPEDSGRAIFVAADRHNSDYVDMQVELEMILRSSRGAENRRLLRIKQLEIPEDGDKLLVVFDTPKPIKGTALLSFSHKVDPDDQWLYLPALKRVKKIASRNKSGPFLSSEFAYEDLTAQEVEKFTYRYLHSESLDDVPCYVVERTPVDDHSGYSRQVVWLDRAEVRVLQIEYYDRRDGLLKRLAVAEYAKHDGRFWKAGRMQMTNHQTRKSTELVWSNYQFGLGLLDERDFSTNALLRVR